MKRERFVFFLLCCREEVRNVPDQLLAYTRRKHYLHATELLNNSGKLLHAVGRKGSTGSHVTCCPSVCLSVQWLKRRES